MVLDPRPADSRGMTRIGWLDSRHSFSFGRYYDPQRMGFRNLRVLNDDRIAPASGFPQHPHRDMEILSWVVEGALAHRDSTGQGAVLRPGAAQVMTAGRGIEHSEYNGSRTEPAHFLQVWLEPVEKGLPPRHAERSFPAGARRNRFALIASPDGAGGSLTLHADARIHVADVDAGEEVTFEAPAGRAAYLHVVTGAVEVNGQRLGAGDALADEQPGNYRIRAVEASQIMLFDLP